MAKRLLYVGGGRNDFELGAKRPQFHDHLLNKVACQEITCQGKLDPVCGPLI